MCESDKWHRHIFGGVTDEILRNKIDKIKIEKKTIKTSSANTKIDWCERLNKISFSWARARRQQNIILIPTAAVLSSTKFDEDRRLFDNSRCCFEWNYEPGSLIIYSHADQSLADQLEQEKLHAKLSANCIGKRSKFHHFPPHSGRPLFIAEKVKILIEVDRMLEKDPYGIRAHRLWDEWLESAEICS